MTAPTTTVPTTTETLKASAQRLADLLHPAAEAYLRYAEAVRSGPTLKAMTGTYHVHEGEARRAVRGAGEGLLAAGMQLRRAMHSLEAVVVDMGALADIASESSRAPAGDIPTGL